MPRIEPVPWSHLSDEQKQVIEQSRGSGLQSQSSMGSQVFAYSSAAFRAMKLANMALFRQGVIEPRLQELLRLRSAIINGCEPCAAARKEKAVTEEDVACLLDPTFQNLSKRERLALSFLEKMAGDTDSINDAFFLELHKEFSTAEIVELGWRCAVVIGGHKFMHCLDMLGSSPAVIKFDPSEIDKSTAAETSNTVQASNAA